MAVDVNSGLSAVIRRFSVAAAIILALSVIVFAQTRIVIFVQPGAVPATCSNLETDALVLLQTDSGSQLRTSACPPVQNLQTDAGVTLQTDSGITLTTD